MALQIQDFYILLIDFLGKYVNRMQSVFQQQFQRSDHEACFRTHLDALLVAAVSNVNDTKPQDTRSLQISFDQPMSFYPFSVDHKHHKLHGQVDYVLWYGRKRDIDTNLVISIAKGGNSPVGATHLSLYMGKCRLSCLLSPF